MPIAAGAQQLNQRKGAPPAAESKKSRLVARAELQARAGGGSLKKEELTVTKSCGNIHVGGTDAAAKARPDSLVGSNQSLRGEGGATVVKNVVNICR